MTFEAPRPAQKDDPEPVPWKAPPVVVELFSSEGCSSCPPADRVLRKLFAERTVEGAEIIALEMHVDYWNDLGWADPFSSEVYTSRQRMYTTILGDRSPYTPQMVVDGRTGFVGSDDAAARRAIARAKLARKANVAISPAKAESPDASVRAFRIVVSGVPDATGPIEVLLALTEDDLESRVTRGENAGEHLVHAPVTRSLTRAGSIAEGARQSPFETVAKVKVPPAYKREKMRAIALVQAADTMAIVGAASSPFE